ncbi:hypothetical protein ACFY2R_29635 [Micromonospora olivasterospora]|uniref:Uncharacterized protein n=1 Tax=Micromonospora olivasterospora TaxID=1880 RepID=A0A562IFK1_MICOL|nr:hypothetical protein [Micromonospora olivasterospora]TWH69799.1 hypothetical protein JD77_04813 [Micromonospora olivasterospora]
MTAHLFALEQYDCSPGADGPRPAFGTPDCRLVAVVQLPTDDVVIALVKGPDADVVAAAAEAAAWRVDRLVPARWIHPPGTESPDPKLS